MKGRGSGLIDVVGPRTRKVVDQLKSNGAMVTSHVKYAVNVRGVHSWMELRQFLDNPAGVAKAMLRGRRYAGNLRRSL
ncbi:MAG: hypothetical protein ACJA0N_002851 [Pseudohongiellaceae bacterium]